MVNTKLLSSFKQEGKYMLDTNTIINLTEKLELKGVNHPILDAAMVSTSGIDWDQEEIYLEFYEYAKKALYFEPDPHINTWLDK